MPEGGICQLLDAGESGSAGRDSQVGEVPTGAGEDRWGLHAGILLSAKVTKGRNPISHFSNKIKSILGFEIWDFVIRRGGDNLQKF